MMTILGITGKCFKESDKSIVDLLKKKKKSNVFFKNNWQCFC